MINALFKKVSYVQILVNTSASIAMIVDNIVVGKFLGVKAVGGYGAVAPLLLLIMAVSQVLSTGGQIKCGEELGKGDLKTANGVASLTVFIALIFSFVMIAVCFIFQQPISNILGAESGSELYDHTVNYLLGFIVGAPAFIGMLVLIPFIQLDGDKSCVVRATIGMTIVDCVGDLLAAMVFNAGMFGIGIASSISYYVAFGRLTESAANAADPYPQPYPDFLRRGRFSRDFYSHQQYYQSVQFRRTGDGRIDASSLGNILHRGRQEEPEGGRQILRQKFIDLEPDPDGRRRYCCGSADRALFKTGRY